MTENQVIIVGAGPAGLGVGIVLKKMGIPFRIIDKNAVGSSFKKWPKEMQFISPSFTGNFFGMPDLNAVSPETSPAYNLQTEHPTGRQYAEYLENISKFYELPVEEGIAVESVTKQKDALTLKTNKGTIESKYVIWAGGEFQYPRLNPFPGSEHCIHNSAIKSWHDVQGDDFIIIGGYESGIDAAVQLAKLGKRSKVLDSHDQLGNLQSDSSYSLSPFTRDRYKENASKIEAIPKSRVEKVLHKDGQYVVVCESGKEFTSKSKPILAVGFKTSLSLVEGLFEWDDDGIQLTEDDESTLCKGLFLVGPQVRHGEAIFCFIYKYRLRFPVVAEAIAKRMGKDSDIKNVIEEYQSSNFYLKDLSCCGDECPC